MTFLRWYNGLSTKGRILFTISFYIIMFTLGFVSFRCPIWLELLIFASLVTFSFYILFVGYQLLTGSVVKAAEPYVPVPRMAVRDMTDEELVAEDARLEKLWREYRALLNGEEGGGSGSPGEWIIERSGEIATEQRRRKNLLP